MAASILKLVLFGSLSPPWALLCPQTTSGVWRSVWGSDMLTHPAFISNDRKLVIRVGGVFPGLAILSVPYKHPKVLAFSQEVILGVEGRLMGRQGPEGPTQLRFPETLFQAVLHPHASRRPLTKHLLISVPSPPVPVSAGGAGTCSRCNSGTLQPYVGAVIQSSIYF